MSKVVKPMTLDEDLVLYYRSQGVNVSGLVNDMLRSHSRIDEADFGELEELETRLDDINEELRSKEKERADVAMKIAMLKDKQKRQNEEQMEKVRFMADTITSSGELNNML